MCLILRQSVRDTQNGYMYTNPTYEKNIIHFMKIYVRYTYFIVYRKHINGQRKAINNRQNWTNKMRTNLIS